MKTSMTTTQAFRQLIRCHAIIAVNVWNSINFFVTRRSWFALALVILIGSAASAMCIMSARAERDRAQQAQAKLQQQVEQLKVENEFIAK
jgi:hypothetical protein